MKQGERRRGVRVVREWIVQPGGSSNINPASFAGPPTLKRDGPKQTRSRTAETVLLE